MSNTVGTACLPDPAQISIAVSAAQTEAFLLNTLRGRLEWLRYAAITGQTPALKVGYFGQHLASLVTGVRGTGSGARGEDLVDRSEVKSCSKIDQLDSCAARDCRGAVARRELTCPACGSSSIVRKDDSKWLFALNTRSQVDRLLSRDRIVLTIADYPAFAQRDFTSLRFRVFEIWPRHARHTRFADLVERHWRTVERKQAAGRAVSAMNFHPDSYAFHLCNPLPIYIATVTKVDRAPTLHTELLVPPHLDRSVLPAAAMPGTRLFPREIDLLLRAATPEQLVHSGLADNSADAIAALLAREPGTKRAAPALSQISEQLRELLLPR